MPREAPRRRTHTAVLFDMDGVLIDSEPVYQAASMRAAAELGFAIDDALYMSLIGRNQADTQAILMSSLGHEFPLDAFNARWMALWQESVERDGVDLKPGIESMLDALLAHGVPVAVATSSNAHQADRVLSIAGLRARFEVVMTGDRVRRGKPAPDIYLEAAARLGESATRCIAIEDSDAGVLSASAAGAATFMIPDLKAPGAQAAAAAYAVLSSLEETWPHMAAMLGLDP